MRDLWNREIDYIRISVTDRCNLRCVYCMPEEGIESISHDRILTFDEIARICRVMAQSGLKKIKLTGGEPLIRRGIVSLVRQLKEVPGIEQVTLTTNGILLEEMADDLVSSGIDAVTVSLDTLDRERFRQMTRRDELPRVLEGIRAMRRHPQIPLKINCLLQEPEKDLPAVGESGADTADSCAIYRGYADWIRPADEIREGRTSERTPEETLRHADALRGCAGKWSGGIFLAGGLSGKDRIHQRS